MAFSAFVTALRALRGHGDVSQRLAELLLADVNRLGVERSKALRNFAATVLEESKEVEEDWELVSDVSLETFAADSGSSQPWLATVRSLLLAQCRTPGGAFCEAQVTVIDRLLELPPPLVETPPSQWSPICRQDAALQSDLEAIEALYGKESIETHADRCVIVVEDLSVVIRFDSTDADRIAVRAVGPSVTTWDEAVASACFTTLQRFRGGSLGALEALQLAMALRRAEEPSAVDPGSLLLAAPPSQWLGLRQETSSTSLEFFSPGDVARHAAEQLQKYLSCHLHFQPAGKAEIVVHDRLAERFATAVALQRVGAKSPTTPSLAFHGAPGQDVLRSICRRGFLMPGDWIEGTPDFLSMEHGNVKGMGVYTSPCLDTAARYSGVYDKDGVGLILVALVAPGAMWREKSRDETQKQISRWFFPPRPKEGQRCGGWVYHRGYWKVADGEASGKQSASDSWDMAFAPDSSALYDGVYNSRLFGTGTKVSEELVLASVDQLLPLLLLPFRSRDPESIPATPMPKLPAQNLPGGRRRRTLCGSRVYEYPSDPLPDRYLLCQKIAAASTPSDELWAIHVDDSGNDGERSYGPALHVLFLVDEALASSEFKKEVPILVETLTGQLQGSTSLVLFNSAGVDSNLCIPWGTLSSFPARFGDRWAKSGARGGGNLAAGILYASDSMISKLAKETEAELLSAGAPWRRLRAGMEIDTTSGEGAVVEDVTFDFQGPSHLEVKWRARASVQESSNLSVVESKAGQLLRAEWGEGSFSEFRLPAVLGAPRAPADVAAETTFAVFTISNFAVVGAEANRPEL
ncbi:unnamed protein product [Symbiodinium sp. CCMP2456]|nr:unnamed protein product [Symbiodinium sp. CCMP2456]